MFGPEAILVGIPRQTRSRAILDLVAYAEREGASVGELLAFQDLVRSRSTPRPPQTRTLPASRLPETEGVVRPARSCDPSLVAGALDLLPTEPRAPSLARTPPPARPTP